MPEPITQTGGEGEVTQTGGVEQPTQTEEQQNVDVNAILRQQESEQQTQTPQFMAQPTVGRGTVEPEFPKQVNKEYAQQVYDYVKNHPEIGTNLSFDDFTNKYFDQSTLNPAKLYKALQRGIATKPANFNIGAPEEFDDFAYVTPEAPQPQQTQGAVSAKDIENTTSHEATNQMEAETDPLPFAVRSPIEDFDEKNPWASVGLENSNPYPFQANKNSNKEEPTPEDFAFPDFNPMVSDTYSEYNAQEQALKQQFKTEKDAFDREQEEKLKNNPIDPVKVFGLNDNAVEKDDAPATTQEGKIQNAQINLGKVQVDIDEAVEQRQAGEDVKDFKLVSNEDLKWFTANPPEVGKVYKDAAARVQWAKYEKALRNKEKFLAAKVEEFGGDPTEADLVSGDNIWTEDPQRAGALTTLRSHAAASMAAGNWEYNKQKLISNYGWEEKDILWAENEIRRKEQAVRKYKELKESTPADLMKVDMFYEHLNQRNQQIAKDMVGVQRDYMSAIQADIETKVTARQKEIEPAMSEEVQLAVKSVTEKYQDRIEEIIDGSEASRQLKEKYQALINATQTGDEEAVAAINQKYREELATIPELVELMEAQRNELDKSVAAVQNKYNRQLEAFANQQVDKGQEMMEKNTKDWLSKQYEPVVLGEDRLNKAIDIIVNDKSWHNANYADKRKIARSAWQKVRKQFIIDNATDPEKLKRIDEAEKEFYFGLTKDILFNPKGAASVYAIKSWAEDAQQTVDEELARLKKNYDFLKDKETKSTAGEVTVSPFGDEKVGLSMSSDYMYDSGVATSPTSRLQDITQKQFSLGRAKENLEDILSHPEGDEEWWTSFDRGIKSLRGYEYVPFVAGFVNVAQNVDLYTAAKKIEEGEPLSYEEQLLVDSHASVQNLNRMRPTPEGYNVGKGLGHMIPYIGEFALTAGVFTAGKKVAEKSVMKAVEKGVEKMLSKKVAARVVAAGIPEGGAAAATREISKEILEGAVAKRAMGAYSYALGALAQSAVNPQQYIANTAERMTPEVAMMLTGEGDNILTQVEAKGEDFGEAFAKGFAMTYAEFFTENLGGHLMKAPKSAFNKLIGNKEWFKRTALGGWMRSHKFASSQAAIEHIVQRRIGWNGIMGEYGEEFVNARMSAILTGDRDPIMDGDWQQEKETFMTVALFGAPFTLAGNVKATVFGRNVEIAAPYKYRGRKEIIRTKIPSHVYRKFNAINGLETEEIPIQALEDLFRANNLNQQQKDVLTQIYFNSNKSKIMESPEWDSFKENHLEETGEVLDEANYDIISGEFLIEEETAEETDGVEEVGSTTYNEEGEAVGQDSTAPSLEASETAQETESVDSKATEEIVPSEKLTGLLDKAIEADNKANALMEEKGEV